MIREEFKKLDSMTGLHGTDLPITFGKAKHTLGCFYISTINKKPKKFHFSLFYFGNSEWSEASVLDVIIHEYAHYMDYMLIQVIVFHGKLVVERLEHYLQSKRD